MIKLITFEGTDGVGKTTQINLFIPVEFINEAGAPGLKRGGVLTVVRPEVELLVTAAEIPEKITVNLEGLDIGDVISISSVTLPDGAKATIDRDFVIANISAPSSLRSSDNDEEEASEEEATADAEETTEEETEQEEELIDPVGTGDNGGNETNNYETNNYYNNESVRLLFF